MIITENEFRDRFTELLTEAPDCDFVTGPGRSGAVASVYASHFLGVPFVPYKQKPEGRFLIVDTAMQSGKTLRKASRLYDDAPYVYAHHEPPRVRFWYEELSLARGIGFEYPKSHCAKRMGRT